MLSTFTLLFGLLSKTKAKTKYKKLIIGKGFTKKMFEKYCSVQTLLICCSYPVPPDDFGNKESGFGNPAAELPTRWSSAAVLR